MCYKASRKNLADSAALSFHLLIWCANFSKELAVVGEDLEGVNLLLTKTLLEVHFGSWELHKGNLSVFFISVMLHINLGC